MARFIFVHGWATDGHVWDNNAPEIAGEGNYLNINLPGHGGNLKWDEHSLRPAVKEIEKTIAGLPERSLIGVGWSLGAQALIASDLAKFRGLILVGATPKFVSTEDFPWGQSKALVKRMIMDMKAGPGETLKRFYALNFTEEEITGKAAKGFIDRYRYPGPVECREGDSETPPGCHPAFRYEEITNALVALYNVELRGRLKEIDLPALVVHGGLDAVTPTGAGEYLARNLKGAELKVFERAGHAPFITEAQRFNDEVGKFARGL